MSDLVTTIKPYFKAVMFEIPDGSRSYTDNGGKGLHAIGIIWSVAN
jgi:hypothetical protein